MKKIFLIILLCLSSTLVFAESMYQFEDFEWGMSLVDVTEKVTGDGKSFKRVEVDGNKKFAFGESNYTHRGYNDEIFGHPCVILLVFTPESKLLAKTAVWWPDRSLAKDITKQLEGRYGKPLEADKGLLYVWGDPETYEMIVMDLSLRGVRVHFYGGEFFKKYKEEQKSENKEKVHDYMFQ